LRAASSAADYTVRWEERVISGGEGRGEVRVVKHARQCQGVGQGLRIKLVLLDN